MFRTQGGGVHKELTTYQIKLTATGDKLLTDDVVKRLTEALADIGLDIETLSVKPHQII